MNSTVLWLARIRSILVATSSVATCEASCDRCFCMLGFWAVMADMGLPRGLLDSLFQLTCSTADRNMCAWSKKDLPMISLDWCQSVAAC